MALVFDLDGTLVDSVYQHVVAWHEALAETGIELSIWRIHRRIGMSGGLFAQALARETGGRLDEATIAELQDRHLKAYRARADQVRALPGAVALLRRLSAQHVKWAIATSGKLASAGPVLAQLGVPEGVPVVTRDQVPHAKPDPDLFLEAARQLDVPPAEVMVVGDSVWDMLAAQRARALGIGLLSGGYGLVELRDAGAYRVYEDPAGLLEHLYEVGGRQSLAR
jgi:HAD superfamily hydrolase (TIGR01549 family)